MKKTRRIKGNVVEEKAGETKEGKERDNVHNRIVTRTSTTCFHNYDLLKIRIGAVLSWRSTPLRQGIDQENDSLRTFLRLVDDATLQLTGNTEIQFSILTAQCKGFQQ